jgi:hypothetical protein
MQQVSGGSGFASENDRRLHFGLGKSAVVDEVLIRWPSGKIQSLKSVSLNRIVKVKEPS